MIYHSRCGERLRVKAGGVGRLGHTTVFVVLDLYEFLFPGESKKAST